MISRSSGFELALADRALEHEGIAHSSFSSHGPTFSAFPPSISEAATDGVFADAAFPRAALAAAAACVAPAPGSAGFIDGPKLAGADDDAVMPPVDQGQSNACGTASLSMIMGYLGRTTSVADLDHEVRRTSFGATPGPLIDFARSHGLAAEGYNNGSWDEMKRFIDRGIPVQALINTQANGDPNNGHFVAVIGFRTDAATGKEQILFRNSADGGKVDAMDRDEFENKWGHHFGYHDFFAAYAPGGTNLPPSRWDGIEALENLATGLSNVSNDFDRVIHPRNVAEEVHGVIGVPFAAVDVAGSAVGFGIEKGGQWLDDKAGKVPVLGAIARPIGKVLTGVGAAVGDVFGGIGNGGEKVAGAFESLFHGHVGDFAKGLWNAGGELVGGIASGIKDLGKGVVNGLAAVAAPVVDAAKAVGGAVVSVGKKILSFFGF